MKELIEADIDNRIMIDEIIGAEERCTNITARTFGICSDEPLMRWSDLMNIIFQGYSDSEVYVYKRYPPINLMYYDSDDWTGEIKKRVLDPKISEVDWDLVNGTEYYLRPVEQNDIYSRLNGVMFGTTVNRVVETIQHNDALGQYLLSVRGHVLSLHYTNKGFYIVDTEHKFRSRKQVEGFLAIDSNKARQSFKEFLNNHQNTRDIKKL